MADASRTNGTYAGDAERIIRSIEHNVYNNGGRPKGSKFTAHGSQKLLVAIVIVAVVGAVYAMQFMQSTPSATAAASTYDARIRFLARDLRLDYSRNATAVYNNTGPFIKSADNISYSVYLGNWSVYTNRTFPAAFGIVNENNYSITVTTVNITGEISGYIRLWLHAHPRMIADTTLGGDDTLEAAADKKLMWDNSTNSSTGNTWIIGAGNHDNTNYKSEYPSGSQSAWTSTWNTTHYAWTYDPNDRGWATNNSAYADVVWFEIDFVLPEITTTGGYGGTITFYFTASGEVA